MKLIIIGAGGNSKVIIDIIKARQKILKEDIEILGLIDDDTGKKELREYSVLGKISDICKYINNEETFFINGIGDNKTRKKIISEIETLFSMSLRGAERRGNLTPEIRSLSPDMQDTRFETRDRIPYYTAIHPSAIIGSNVTIGEGTVVMPNAVINIGSQIGRHCIINTGAIVEHDNRIGDYAHLASGVVTAGNVTIDNLTFLGTGSKVIQGLEIGENTIIGAGAVVVKDIPENCTAVGVPAKVIKSRD